jgi:hypothetical protein
MKAQIINGKIAEILVPVAGFSLEECFHPSVLAQCTDVADEAQVGWVQQEDGSFAAPIVEAPAETPEEPTA